MRKKIMGRKFARNTNSRKALFRGLVRSMFEQGSIQTTWAKAKAVQPEIDKLVTLAKKDTLSARRSVMAKLGNDSQTYQKLFGIYIPAFANRKSGFTKLTHLPTRSGDKAKMVKLEFSDKAIGTKPVKKEKVKEKTVKPKTAKRVVKKDK